MKILHVGTNTHKIDAIWAFISVDENGNEGICGAQTTLGWMPLVTSDEDLLSTIRPFAEAVSYSQSHTIKLIKFTERTNIETIG